jgi:ABC transport system ATP-binding/permease protein
MAPLLLSLRDATVRLGGEPLFAGLSLAVAAGDRICLVGRNGSGKSTLLRALAGLIELDAGERFVQPGTTIACLAQEPAPPAARRALEVVIEGLPADRAEAAHEAEAMLERFGIDPASDPRHLSGGELRRVALAQTLVARPEILLLDEPTNHLDIATIEQLEQDLAGFRGALVMVSHDRAFLRALSRTTWWLDRGRLRVLNAGFAAFDAFSEQVLAEEEAALARLDETIAEETWWSHHGITARRKRNQGRMRRLDALRRERQARIAPTGRVKLAASDAGRGARLVIEAEAIAKGYGGRMLFEGFSTRIQKGDRVGVVGPNGVGKTTLLRLLTGQDTPDAGTVRLADDLAIAYVDQKREGLDPEASLWDTLCPAGGDQVMVQGRPRHVVSYLRDFLFRADQARTPTKALSGGERNRLLLARQLAAPCDLMVLDEPTNDLDLDTLDLLQEVLADFAGTLLLVSHDRDFLDRLVTSVIAFEPGGRLIEYAGGWSDMQRQRQAVAEERAPAPVARPRPRPARAEPGGAPRRPERDLERTLGRIEALEAEIGEVERQLADPDLYRRDPDTFAAMSARLEVLRAELAQTEARWAELERLLAARS